MIEDLDDFNPDAARHRAEAFSGALSIMHFVSIRPADWQAMMRSESPEMRALYRAKLVNARLKIEAILAAAA